MVLFDAGVGGVTRYHHQSGDFIHLFDRYHHLYLL